MEFIILLGLVAIIGLVAFIALMIFIIGRNIDEHAGKK